MPPPGVCLNIMEARNKQEGFGTMDNPERFLNQDYQQLMQYCLARGVRYIDDMFPPDRRSIGEGLLDPADMENVVWLRPAKIAPRPAFILDGVSRFDFAQGILGNCWFLASIGSLTFQKQILGQVVPLEQTFDEDYCGLFHFKFWRFGKWVDVIIDDKLPTVNGNLIFVHSKDENEFWPALLEKAYAKVCGSFADMRSGTPAEAMMDFSGGVNVSIKLSEPPPDLWELLCRAGQTQSLMGCGTQQGSIPGENSELANGLIAGHAYTITGVKEMMSRGTRVKLVRLMNPWGRGEWVGDWSDRSSLWKTVSAQDRDACLSVSDDGEFWMTLEDFSKCYEDLDICCLNPSFLDGSSCQWKTSMYEGRWVAGTTAGGCMNCRETFWTNPQFRIKIGEGSERDGKERNTVVTLMQKPDKRNRRLVKSLHIGFTIFEVTGQYESQRGKFPASFFNSHAPVAQTKTYLNARQLMEFVMLKPGEYLIVPSAFRANETASFILTIRSKGETIGYESSSDHKHEPIEKVKKVTNHHDDQNKKRLFRQYSDMYEEVDAEQLQGLLNDDILKGDLKSGGFTIDACRSMVALMDTSITGKLNGEEFIRLWKKVSTYKDVFFLTDVSRTGTLSLSELRNAFIASDYKISDDMLNLMALRYTASSGHMSLENFISLILRLDCMHKIFKQLSDGKNINLKESEWIYITMYT